MQLVEQMSRLGTETAFEVLAKARVLEAEGKDVIHLEIGEPDFPTPAYIVEAGKRALDEGWTKYGPTPGIPELREAIAAHISHTRNPGIPGFGDLLFRTFRRARACIPGAVHFGPGSAAGRRTGGASCVW